LFERFVQAHRAGFPVKELIVGGGFGVSSEATGAPQVEVAAIVGALGEHLRTLAKNAAVHIPRLGIEPGRAIIAEAGTTLYRVLSVKQHGSSRFVIVDGGLTDNPRPLLYGAYHHPLAAAGAAASGPRFAPAVICGRSCENDVLVEAELPQGIVRGDLIAMVRLAAARERTEEILRLDVTAP